VQESLTNVTRHAEASRVEITLSQSTDDLIVEVRDDGKGFDPAYAAMRKSFGLLGMRERATVLGGSIDIISMPQQGTVVSVRIPMQRTVSR
jgi:signal transduction histidine kinase